MSVKPYINKKNTAFHASPYGGIEREGFKLSYAGSTTGSQCSGLGIYFKDNIEGVEEYRYYCPIEMRHKEYKGSDGKPGQVYKVELPGIKHFIDYFAPISNQPSARVRKILEGIVAAHGFTATISNELCGHDVVYFLEQCFQQEIIQKQKRFDYCMAEKESALAARAYLTNKGIYGEVVSGYGETMYVVWDEAQLTPDVAKIQPLF